MAHFKCKRARTNPRHRKVKLFTTPTRWNVQHHTRPRRQMTKALLHGIRDEARDVDDLAWPLGNSRPHIYFW